MTLSRPQHKPSNPCFSSGPTSKYPGWSASDLEQALVGRSHRSAEAFQKIEDLIRLTRQLLNIPKDYQIAIVPGSTTGAFTMGLWSLLGPCGVDVLAWEVFGQRWALEVEKGLRFKDVRVLKAPIGSLPDLSRVDANRDIIFSWNGTTSGVCVPNGEWIPHNRKGLVFCDAISAIFAMELPWEKLDFTAFSWQKTLGGESGFGMIILSPRALERLEHYTPSHPIPGLLNLKGYSGEIKQGLFQGATPNTISLLCVEDFFNALKWAQTIGGQKALQKRTSDNFSTIASWVNNSQWATFLAKDSSYQSKTTTCLTLQHPHFQKLSEDKQWEAIKDLTTLLATEKVAYDIKNHQRSHPSLRIWTGPTVEKNDISALLPWLDWGYEKVIQPILTQTHSKEASE